MRKICVYMARILALAGCYFGIKASLNFITFAGFFAIIEALFEKKLLISYMFFGNAFLGIATSILGAIISFGRNRRNASIFLVVFAVLGLILVPYFYLTSTYLFFLSALLLFISNIIEENKMGSPGFEPGTFAS